MLELPGNDEGRILGIAGLLLVEGTDVTVIVKGFWVVGICADVEGTEVGVTVTLGAIVGFFGTSVEAGNKDCSLAAERPSTISSSFLRFFSLPTTGSGSGCRNKKKGSE